MLELTGGKSLFCDGISRRNALKAGLLGLGGLALPDMLRLRAQAAATRKPLPATSVIYLELAGGPPQTETYDPKPDAPAEFRGPFGVVKTHVPGVILCELMAEQAKVMDRLAIIRSIHHDSSNHEMSSHLTQTGYYSRSGLSQDNEMPAVGSITAKLRGANTPGMPAYVAVPNEIQYGDAAYLGKQYNPLETDGDPNAASFQVRNLALHGALSPARLDARRQLLAALDRERRVVDAQGDVKAWDEFNVRAFEMVTGSRAQNAFDIGREPVSVRDRYGRTTVGQSMLLARRLVEAGVTFVTVRVTGWDMHFDVDKNMVKIGIPFDQGTAALVSDLVERGMNRDVLVVAMGEFGRTPRLNNRGGGIGRDHWGDLMSVMLAGGRYRMGQVIGASNDKGETPIDRPYRPESVLAMVYDHLGLDPAMTIDDLSGRPRHLLEHREPIIELY